MQLVYSTGQADWALDSLVSYLGHLLGVESRPSAEMQSVFSTVQADWAMIV